MYTAFSFQDEMWRPLYWFVNGVAPTETPAMSLANTPVYSNGNRTVTITLKNNYIWSDGRPLTSKDVPFSIDEVRAAVNENPANWAGYTPKVGLPDQVVSASMPNAATLVLNLNSAVNPLWMTDNELALPPMPAHAWAKASANGPVLDFTKPANAKKIYDFLAAESRSVSTYASNPLWRFHRHLIPNALGVIIVNVTFNIADAILAVATLGFLGFGLHYPDVDWGDMLSNGTTYLQDGYWWLIYPVGTCIVLVVMACNLLGDALRDSLDVRLRRR